MSHAQPNSRQSSANAANCIVGIDTHAHVFRRNAALVSNRRYTPERDAPIADYLAMLDGNGMSHGVLIQPSFLGTDNSYLLEALRMAPTRLRGIVVVAPDIGRDALAALDVAGCVGIRLNLIGQPDPVFGSALWNSHLQNLADLGWQVEIQAEARRLAALLPPLLATGVPLVIDHFGRPDPLLGVDDPGFRYLLNVGPARKIWVKLSAAYRLGPKGETACVATQAAALLCQTLGATRLLWGSDWPHTQFMDIADPSSARRALDTWVADPADRQMVLQDTPASLFRFGAVSP